MELQTPTHAGSYAKPGERIRIGFLACDPRPSRFTRNLRGILDHARRAGVRAVYLTMTDDYGARVHMSFGDGAFTRFEFASWDVAQRWFRARRSWALIPFSVTATRESYCGPC